MEVFDDFSLHVIKRLDKDDSPGKTSGGREFNVNSVEQTVTLADRSTFAVDMVHEDRGDDVDFLLPDQFCECVRHSVLSERPFVFVSFSSSPDLLDELLDPCLRELFDALREGGSEGSFSLRLWELSPPFSPPSSTSSTSSSSSSSSSSSALHWRALSDSAAVGSLRQARRALAAALRGRRRPHVALSAARGAWRLWACALPPDGAPARAAAAALRRLRPLREGFDSAAPAKRGRNEEEKEEEQEEKGERQLQRALDGDAADVAGIGASRRSAALVAWDPQGAAAADAAALARALGAREIRAVPRLSSLRRGARALIDGAGADADADVDVNVDLDFPLDADFPRRQRAAAAPRVSLLPQALEKVRRERRERWETEREELRAENERMRRRVASLEEERDRALHGEIEALAAAAAAAGPIGASPERRCAAEKGTEKGTEKRAEKRTKKNTGKAADAAVHDARRRQREAEQRSKALEAQNRVLQFEADELKLKLVQEKMLRQAPAPSPRKASPRRPLSPRALNVQPRRPMSPLCKPAAAPPVTAAERKKFTLHATAAATRNTENQHQSYKQSPKAYVIGESCDLFSPSPTKWKK